MCTDYRDEWRQQVLVKTSDNDSVYTFITNEIIRRSNLPRTVFARHVVFFRFRAIRTHTSVLLFLILLLSSCFHENERIVFFFFYLRLAARRRFSATQFAEKFWWQAVVNRDRVYKRAFGTLGVLVVFSPFTLSLRLPTAQNIRENSSPRYIYACMYIYYVIFIQTWNTRP